MLKHLYCLQTCRTRMSCSQCEVSLTSCSFCFNRLADITLEPFETEITTKSSPRALALAKHLQLIGAKMYGAFWCSHCLEQKQVPFSSKKKSCCKIYMGTTRWMEMPRNVLQFHF